VPLADVVAMQTRQPNLEGTGEVRLRRLVKEALRMRPERIIVGEVRQEECLDLLIDLNIGYPVNPDATVMKWWSVGRAKRRDQTAEQPFEPKISS
jgi:type IV secretory pathway ATPase VirB11/archaellum biosynthesis ATPase